MYPYIHTPLGNLSVFTIFAALGTVAMLISVYLSLKTAADREGEIVYIYPKIVLCGMVGVAFAALTDAFFKFLRYGVFKLYGISFYGGLIGGVISMFFVLKVFGKGTQYTVAQWFDKLTLPLVVFHFFGRLGCFFGGCCYGKYATGLFTLTFPDNEIDGIIHNGMSCYPTQLFEAFGLVIIFVLLLKSKGRFKTYLLLYALLRFALEFLRGDDRGGYVLSLSPAQLISTAVITLLLLAGFYTGLSKNK